MLTEALQHFCATMALVRSGMANTRSRNPTRLAPSSVNIALYKAVFEPQSIRFASASVSCLSGHRARFRNAFVDAPKTAFALRVSRASGTRRRAGHQRNRAQTICNVLRTVNGLPCSPRAGHENVIQLRRDQLFRFGIDAIR